MANKESLPSIGKLANQNIPSLPMDGKLSLFVITRSVARRFVKYNKPSLPMNGNLGTFNILTGCRSSASWPNTAKSSCR
jgi:hypothetical protein